jgi:hypothetical protein
MRKDIHWKQVLKRIADGYAEPVYGAVAITTVPAILHVNFEAREFAKKYYQLSFSDFLMDKPVHFNFAIDTLYFEGFGADQAFFWWKGGLSDRSVEELMKIRHIAHRSAYNPLLREIVHFRELERFIAVVPKFFMDSPRMRNSIIRVLGSYWLKAGVEWNNIPEIIPANERQLACKKVFELTGYKLRSYKKVKTAAVQFWGRFKSRLVALSILPLLVSSRYSFCLVWSFISSLGVLYLIIFSRKGILCIVAIVRIHSNYSYPFQLNSGAVRLCLLIGINILT